MSMLRRSTGWILTGFTLALHVFIVWCFVWQPDHFAAITVLPIWLWGAFGILLSVVAFYLLRVPLPVIMTGVWCVTLLAGADEAHALLHIGKSGPQRGPAAAYQGRAVIRVVSLNCNMLLTGDPTRDIAVWQPDIVLLQDAPAPLVNEVANVLYGSRGDFRARQTNGIATRWKIQRVVDSPTRRNQQATIVLPDGRSVEIVNVHLVSAATDLRFWRRLTWREHRINRAWRHDELTQVRGVLGQTTDISNTPTLFGGDFNAPATDIVLRGLDRDFVDAFRAVGTGWGDTYQRHFPILRIDHIYATRHFTPVRFATITTRFSDHRMVVADFVLKQP